ncbi:unnamed protein product [Periconia digitata]|uniref:Cytochrome P450 n=1 Tax=Periconia digitata TaxID=1303443 RepID=A0A9W4UCB4_9PLEO|nr:unnamed protein product [Periconia digitata]
MEYLPDVLENLSHGSPVVYGLLFVTLLAIVGNSYKILRGDAGKYPLAGYSPQHSFPALRARLGWFLDGSKYIDEAFEKYPDQIFRLPSLNRLSLVLPAKYLDEVKDAPERILSNAHSVSEFFVGEWTGMDYTHFDPYNLDAFKAQYISKLPPQVEVAAGEANFAVGKVFSIYEEWTPISLYKHMLPFVLRLTTRTIVGEEICRNTTWVESLIGWETGVAIVSTYLRVVPPFLRGVAYLIPEYYRLLKHKRRMHQVLEPPIKEFLDARKSGNKWSSEEDVKILLENYAQFLPEHEMTPSKLAHRLVGSSFGAFHLTAGVVNNCVLDLATHFEEYAPALRQEIDEVLGDSDNITNALLVKMWKLDSFTKESLRFHPPHLISCNRKVMQPFQLSSGAALPVGSHICFPSQAMSMSDEYLPNARAFDGFRFEKMRLDPTTQDQNGLQFTSASAATMHMGGGRQQCPGRFFGSAVTKICLIKLLRAFDFKLVGEKRPANLMLMDVDAAHPEAEIMIRSRAY